jgi:hypothetical protein
VGNNFAHTCPLPTEEEEEKFFFMVIRRQGIYVALAYDAAISQESTEQVAPHFLITGIWC